MYKRQGTVSAASRYGAVALLLRTAQVAALVFWIALLSCAEKGWAGIAIVLSVVVVFVGGIESALRSEKKTIWAALVLCALHLALVGGMAAVFFGDEQAEGWAGAAALLGGMLVSGGGCLFAGCTRKVFEYDSDSCLRHLSLCCALVCVPLLLGGTIYAFVTAEHMDNNYANLSLIHI